MTRHVDPVSIDTRRKVRVTDDMVDDAGDVFWPFPQLPGLIRITGPWAVCVGPEAGWSPRELALLDENNAHNLKVADHVLRTPTAVAAALAVAQHLCVD